MRLRAGVTMTHTDDGTYLLDTRSGRYWHLDPSGVDVLRSLVSGEQLEAVVERIAAAHQVDRAVVADDCASLLRDLRTARLLRRSR